MGDQVSEIEFVNCVVSGNIECDCGQCHIFLGVRSTVVGHTCEQCGREYRLIPPRLTVEEVREE